MIDKFSCSRSILRVDVETGFDEFTILRDNVLINLVPTVSNVVNDSSNIRRFERSIVVDELETKDSEAPNIDSSSVLFPVNYFWSHVLVSSADNISTGITRRAAPAEVAKLDDMITINEKVL